MDDCLLSTIKTGDHILDIVNTLIQTDTLQQAMSFTGLSSSSATTYSVIMDDVQTYPASLTSYVVALHAHIFKKNNLKDMDKYLEENYMQVGQHFADLANSLNFNITRIGTMSGRWTDVDDPIDEISKGEYSGLDLTWDLIGGTNRCD
jgi:hypothetical protein